MQWLHVASVVIVIGGFFFLGTILLPIARKFPEAYRKQLTESAFRRFRVVVWIGLITILVSGIYNFVSFFQSVRADVALGTPPGYFSSYILFIAIKLFIVFIIFTFGVVLTFPYPVFAPFQNRPSPWVNLTLAMGIIVIFISTFLRRLH